MLDAALELEDELGKLELEDRELETELAPAEVAAELTATELAADEAALLELEDTVTLELDEEREEELKLVVPAPELP